MHWRVEYLQNRLEEGKLVQPQRATVISAMAWIQASRVEEESAHFTDSDDEEEKVGGEGDEMKMLY